ncbi:hypothetical protein GCM10009738_73830 [Kitasatospora viridis]
MLGEGASDGAPDQRELARTARNSVKRILPPGNAAWRMLTLCHTVGSGPPPARSGERFRERFGERFGRGEQGVALADGPRRPPR